MLFIFCSRAKAWVPANVVPWENNLTLSNKSYIILPNWFIDIWSIDFTIKSSWLLAYLLSIYIGVPSYTSLFKDTANWVFSIVSDLRLSLTKVLRVGLPSIGIEPFLTTNSKLFP